MLKHIHTLYIPPIILWIGGTSIHLCMAIAKNGFEKPLELLASPFAGALLCVFGFFYLFLLYPLYIVLYIWFISGAYNPNKPRILCYSIISLSSGLLYLVIGIGENGSELLWRTTNFISGSISGFALSYFLLLFSNAYCVSSNNTKDHANQKMHRTPTHAHIILFLGSGLRSRCR